MPIRVLLAVLLLSLPPATSASDEQVRQLLFADAVAAQSAAVAAEAETYAPRNFAAGTEALADAARDFELNRPLERIRQRVAEATQSFRTAASVAVQARETFASLIKLRTAARSVDAGLHDQRQWLLGERRFEDTLVEFERGDERLAMRRAGEAEQAYRQAELAAIKAAYLNEARRVLGEAEDARAERFAPITFARARQILATASTELTENRYDTDRPRDLARQAEYEARHALFLANAVQRARKENIDAEALILAGEVPLQQIAGNADLAVKFDQGYEIATTMIIDYINNLQADFRRTQQELYERVAQVEALQTQLDSLEARLGGVSEERRIMEAQLARQAREREQFARIETMFRPDQADVLRSSGDVIVRLVGNSFPVGEATITPDAYGLLKTVIQAIRVFPDAKIVIEGHTDAYGGDALNMKLSQERADAVRAYLLANMDIAESRLDAKGYGETKPIANNETREGRAKNRRIDILIRPRMAPQS